MRENRMRICVIVTVSLFATFVGSLDVADARTARQCESRQQTCSLNCFNKANKKGTDAQKVVLDWMDCNNRTCDPQYNSCMKDASDSNSKLADPGTGSRERPPRGLLEPSSGFSRQTPSATGTPLGPSLR